MNTERFFEGPGASSGPTYVLEITIILLGAFVLGYLLRSILNGSLKSKLYDLESENSVLRSKSLPEKRQPVIEAISSESDTKIKNQKSELDDLNNRLSECYAKRIKAENALSALQTEVEKSNKEPIIQIAKETPSKPTVAETSETMIASIGGQKEDLKKIEGIGPKIEELLNTDGIYTYKQVIASSVERIKGILIAAGPNYAVHDPSTWGEQASLADSGSWEKLDALQEELKGGKRKD
jgi:predicted flap endonuclease-1-like 5' DNA nuclease